MKTCSLTIAHSDRLPPWPLSPCRELSKSGPLLTNPNLPALVYLWPLTLALVSSTSWTVCSSEGPEKHHGMDWESILNFTPPLVRSAPIQVNVICVVKWKTSFVLLATNCMQPAPCISPKNSSDAICTVFSHYQLPTAKITCLAHLGQQSYTALVLPHFTLVRRWVGLERHCIDKTFQLMQCLFNVLLLLSQLLQLHLFPILWNLNLGKFSKRETRQCNVTKTCCTAALKNTGMNLMYQFIHN